MSKFPEVEARYEEILRSPLARKILVNAIERGNASGLAHLTMTYIVDWDGGETAFDASECLNPVERTIVTCVYKVDGIWQKALPDMSVGTPECSFWLATKVARTSPNEWVAKNGLTLAYGDSESEAWEAATAIMFQLLNEKASKGRDYRWLSQGGYETGR